jgi:hypothetical protein
VSQRCGTRLIALAEGNELGQVAPFLCSEGPHFASVLQEGWKDANILASSGVIWRIPASSSPDARTLCLFHRAAGASHRDDPRAWSAIAKQWRQIAKQLSPQLINRPNRCVAGASLFPTSPRSERFPCSERLPSKSVIQPSPDWACAGRHSPLDFWLSAHFL